MDNNDFGKKILAVLQSEGIEVEPLVDKSQYKEEYQDEMAARDLQEDFDEDIHGSILLEGNSNDYSLGSTTKWMVYRNEGERLQFQTYTDTITTVNTDGGPEERRVYDIGQAYEIDADKFSINANGQIFIPSEEEKQQWAETITKWTQGESAYIEENHGSIGFGSYNEDDVLENFEIGQGYFSLCDEDIKDVLSRVIEQNPDIRIDSTHWKNLVQETGQQYISHEEQTFKAAEQHHTAFNSTDAHNMFGNDQTGPQTELTPQEQFGDGQGQAPAITQNIENK